MLQLRILVRARTRAHARSCDIRLHTSAAAAAVGGISLLPRLMPPPTDVADPSAIKVQLVVASSCGRQVDWAVQLATQKKYQVIVLEQCDDSGNLTIGTSSQRVQYMHIKPNLGREAHAYLWYIVHHYSRLGDFTVFMQSDAPRHLPSGFGVSKRIDAAVAARYSFLSMTGNVVSGGHRSSISLETYCALYRNFSLPSPSSDAPCKGWNSVTWAHFIVSREAIRSHSRETYRQLMLLFEDPQGLERAFRTTTPGSTGTNNISRKEPWEYAAIGATFLERSWSFVFGCARPITSGSNECLFWPNETVSDLVKRCNRWNKPLYNSWLGNTVASSGGPKENSSKIGCKSVHPFNQIRGQDIQTARPTL